MTNKRVTRCLTWGEEKAKFMAIFVLSLARISSVEIPNFLKPHRKEI